MSFSFEKESIYLEQSFSLSTYLLQALAEILWGFKGMKLRLLCSCVTHTHTQTHIHDSQRSFISLCLRKTSITTLDLKFIGFLPRGYKYLLHSTEFTLLYKTVINWCNHALVVLTVVQHFYNTFSEQPVFVFMLFSAGVPKLFHAMS